jgi:Omp85 superfamily domain
LVRGQRLQVIGELTKALRDWRAHFLPLIIGLFSVLSASPVVAQDQKQEVHAGETSAARATSEAIAGQSSDQDASGKENAPSVEKKESRGAFVVAPLPISSPALGSGIVPVLFYIFPFSSTDKTSPASILGAAGLATDNGSRALVLGGQLYFKENSYRMTAAYARGNLNYDLYGLGSGDSQAVLPLEQKGQAVFAEILRRIGWQFFLGPRFIWGSSAITLRSANTENLPEPPGIGLQTSLTALGLGLYRDTRPNRFYPTRGTFFNATADFFSQGLGSKYSFQSYKIVFNKYWSLGDSQILAYNVFACLTGGDPPFYGNCIYGAQNELRGYIAGQYLDRYMGATQLEYRLVLPKRFGLVVFGGLGGVIPGGNQVFQTKNFLPAGGAGGRFLLSKRYHVNLRIDFAQGKDTHTWSLGVGEAF